MNTRTSTLLAAAASVTLISSASAATLVDFQFTGADPAAQIAGGAALAPNSTAAGVNVTGVSGIVPNPNTDGTQPNSPAGILIPASSVSDATDSPAASSAAAFRDNLLAFGVVNQDAVDGTNGGNAATLAEVVAANTSFLTFSIEPDAGGMIDLDSVSFDFWAGQGNQSADMVALLTSVDGFTTPVGQFDQGSAGNNSDGTLGSSTYSNIDTVTFNLDDADFGNLTSEVELRLYVFSGQDGLNGNAMRRYNVIDNLLIQGSVTPIPEPSAVLLGGVGAGLTMLRRRQR